MVTIATIKQKLETASATHIFIYAASGILAITGAAKIWSAFGHVRLLDFEDPITGVPFRYLMGIVGLMELTIACVCLFSGRMRLSMVLVAWLTTSFLIYRLGLWWVGWESPCHCLGNLTDALHIPPKIADTAMKIVLAYLLISSYASLFWLWRQKRKAALVAPTREKTTGSAS